MRDDALVASGALRKGAFLLTILRRVVLQAPNSMPT